jgi:hypothetical protein
MGLKGWEEYVVPKDRGEGERALPRGVRRRVGPSGDGRGVQAGGGGDCIGADGNRRDGRGSSARAPRVKGARVCYVDPTTRQLVSVEVTDALTGDVRERLERFQSEREAKRWLWLLAEQDRGAVRSLRRQVAYPLNVRRPDGHEQTIATWTADYVYERFVSDPAPNVTERWEPVVEDCKGFKTEIYRRSRRHFEAQYGIRIYES